MIVFVIAMAVWAAHTAMAGRRLWNVNLLD